MNIDNEEQIEQSNDNNESEIDAEQVEEELSEFETHITTIASTQRAPSEHSYLPGVSHPLYPRELIKRRKERTSSFECHRNNLRQTVIVEKKKLAVLEVENVVIFPGSTIPLRFRNKTWKDYLRREIQMARDLKRIPKNDNVGYYHQTYNSHDDDDHDDDVAKTGRVTIGILTKIEKNSSSSSEDSQKGRIGTLVVITALHDNGSSHHNNTREENIHIDDDIQDESNSEPIIVTAVGTERFEVVSKHESRRYNVVNNGYVDRNNRHSYLKNISFYHVKICPDQDNKQYLLPTPSLRLFPHHTSLKLSLNEEHSSNFNIKKWRVEYKETNDIIYDQNEKRTDQQHCHHQHYQNQIHNMSYITSVPTYVWKMTCPQHLQQQISFLIYNYDIFIGLRSSSNVPPPLSHSSLPDIDNDLKSDSQQSEINPLTVSYWISSNLPLSESQRIELLNIHCLTKRLRRILSIMKDMVGIEKTKVISQNKPKHASEETKDSEKSKDNQRFYCQICSADICDVKETFTVNGAEGISGAYVNEHGIIHQTITVRNVMTRNVVLIGGSETKDSWFPGYSWTILYCRCGNHIGWKYKIVEENQDSSTQLKHFWGLSHASVSTVKMSQRVSYSVAEDMFINFLADFRR